tara:strand:- start:1462 stop:1719 length:258 start_codon:yes stop_codon:yes gene_type:complete
MAKAKKITKKELTEITELQSQIQNILIGIGSLEAQKTSGVVQLRMLEDKMEQGKLAIEKKYGSVNVDLQTGVITPIEEEPKLETV